MFIENLQFKGQFRIVELREVAGRNIQGEIVVAETRIDFLGDAAKPLKPGDVVKGHDKGKNWPFYATITDVCHTVIGTGFCDGQDVIESRYTATISYKF